MIPKYLIGAAAGISLLIGAWFHGNYHGKKIKDLEIQTAKAEASELARAQERQKQEAINAHLQSQKDELDIINSNLLSDISRLQQRANRRLSEASTTDCKGATGAELSAKDAEFLVRETARADRLRTALKSCYQHADEVVR